MKKGFPIANGIALFLAFVSIGWLVYDFFMFGFLRSKMRRMETLLPFDETGFANVKGAHQRCE